MPVFGREDPDYFDQKGYSGGGGPGGGTSPGGGGGAGSLFGPSGGFGGFGSGPVYDRSVPQYGYRRLAFGPMFNQRTTGPAGNDYGAMAGQPGQSVQVGPGAQGMANPSGGNPFQIIQNSGMFGFPNNQGIAPMPAQQMGGGYGGGYSPFSQFSPQGSPTGGFSQGDPWSAYGGDLRGDLPGFENRQLGLAGQAGVFDPLGSQALLGAIGQQFANQAGGRQAGIRNSLMAGTADDPNAFAYGSLMGDLGLQHDLSGAQSQAQLASMLQNQQFNQFLADQMMGNANQEYQQRIGAKLMPKPNSGLGGLLGSLGGAALGSFFGPMGMQLGSSLGGSLFGGGSKAAMPGASFGSGGSSGYDPYGFNPMDQASYGWGGPASGQDMSWLGPAFTGLYGQS